MKTKETLSDSKYQIIGSINDIIPTEKLYIQTLRVI